MAKAIPLFEFGLLVSGYGVKSFVIHVDEGLGSNAVPAWISPRLTMEYYTPERHAFVTYGKNTGGQVYKDSLTPGVYRWRVDFQGSGTEPANAPCECVHDPRRCSGKDTGLPRPEQVSFVGSKSQWQSFVVE